MNSPEGSNSRTRWWFAFVVVLAIVAAAGSWYAFGRDDHVTSRADTSMAARAAQVMPFDLNRTTHVFTKTANGGIEKVVVDRASDTRNRGLIRSHLRTEAANFRRGIYSDPAKIHGMAMPGLAELEEGATRIKVTFAEIDGGAQITYTSTEPGLISALHDWFDRQSLDHSAPGMGG